MIEKQGSATLRRDKLETFKGWLRATGWTVNSGLGKAELIRASRSVRGPFLFIYDGADTENLTVFDIAAREVERFTRSEATCSPR